MDDHEAALARASDPLGHGRWGALSDLPGHPMMWILIVSELLVFGGGLIAFAAAHAAEPAEFAKSQAGLDRLAGTINTALLLTSGLAAALAVIACARGAVRETRLWLLAAGVMGLGFLAVKGVEYGAKWQAGIGLSTNTFYTLYYLLTGFHALHVVAGILILALVAVRPSLEAVETGTAFWHMVDLVWVLLFPIVYLVR